MDQHSEHSGELSFGFSLSRGPSLLEKNSLVSSGTKNKNDIKYTMAYEKGLMKERCGLCKMYFHRNSVNYKVPNHRILELERKWNVKREGRRYASAGYLYKMIEVCCFCSQFFKLLPSELPEPVVREPEPKPIKLDISTTVARCDIAQGKRTYSSSSVDNRTAEMAILPPYEQFCRTRREVDPWWEIDFSRSYHVHSLSFLVSTGKHQTLYLSVFLLNKPLGFEDPFVDSIKNKAVASKCEVIPPHDVSEMKEISWIFEPGTTCFAIRIQLKGVHSLAVQRFKVLQGDQLVITTDEDLAQTINSYSSLSPEAVRVGKLEMMSPEEKKQLVRENDPCVNVDDKLREKCMPVGTLAQQIQWRKDRIDSWKDKVRSIASMFHPAEVETLYRVVFKPTLEAKPCLKDAPPLQEDDLLDGALIQFYPRCDLGELHTRLRSVVRWVQTRTHLKVLGSLANSHNFDVVANDPNSHLHRLSSAFKKVDAYWAKCEARERLMMESSQDLGFVGVKAAEARGCSWAQFLIVMALFCTQQCKQIPGLAFFLDNIGVTSDLAHRSQHLQEGGSGGGSPGMTSSTHHLRDDDVSVGSSSDANGAAFGHYSHSQSGVLSAFNGTGPSRLSPGRSRGWLDRLATPTKLNPPKVVIEQKTFLQKAREAEQFPYFNSSFAEYKFWHFQRRSILQHMDFPPELDLDFARSLVPKRAATSHSASRSLPALGNTAPVGAAKHQGGEGGTVSAPASIDGPLEEGSMKSGFSGTSETRDVPRPGTQGRAALAALGGGPGANLLSTPSRKFRQLPSAAVGSPSGKFMASSASAKVLGSPSTKANLMSASLSSLEGLTRGSSFLLAPGSSFLLAQGSLTRSSTSRDLALPQTGSRPQTTGGGVGNTARSSKHTARPASPANDDASNFSGSDLLSLGDGSKTGRAPLMQSTGPIDFFRVCALCELKFPRDCMEMKVMRKHVVQLRKSWDPALVSKEVRLLDHTISMYSLVHVCIFCSQFFDPDFPDGIAYPVRMPSPVPKVRGALDAIKSQSAHTPLQLHYDTRHVGSVVERAGEVFARPHSVEARSRAQRAREIDQRHRERQAAVLEATLKAK